MGTVADINRLSVVDPDGKLLGVVTRLDVLEALTR